MVREEEKKVDDELREAGCLFRWSRTTANKWERDGGGRVAVEEGSRSGGEDTSLRTSWSEMAADDGDSRRTRWSAVAAVGRAADSWS